MEIVLEIALVFLLMATLVHALKLERALGVLKRDRAALQDLVDGFNASTRSAEQGIERLRSAADGVGRQIGRQTELAAGLKDDLVFLIERGERTADQLDKSLRSSRNVADLPRPEIPTLGTSTPDKSRPDTSRPDTSRPDTSRPDTSRRETSRMDPQVEMPRSDTSLPRPAWLRAAETDEEPRVRSQAERDLLKALRMAR